MSTANELIEQAFDRLAEMPGYTSRPDQRQLSLLLSDMIEGGGRGAFEAPTGLGKSLAALIPAIAHGIASGRRTVIATYTNVLAEQYWRQDLPLALSLFEPTDDLKCQFLIGRQRYACLSAIDEHSPELRRSFVPLAKLGIETELRDSVRNKRDVGRLWPLIGTPPVCQGRSCSNYNSCYYYQARKVAQKAHVVITNHSVVIQDALIALSSDEGEAMLGTFDFLILDEAHDFPQAATNGLEFELSGNKLASIVGLAARLNNLLLPIAQSADEADAWMQLGEEFKREMERCQRALVAYSLRLGQPGILKASPAEVMEHEVVQGAKTPDGLFGAQRIAEVTSEACLDFAKKVERTVERWRDSGRSLGQNSETVRTYLSYIREYGAACYLLFMPEGVAVSYVGRNGPDAMLRADVIGLADRLTEMIWDRTPYACLSATLALDGNFDFFSRVTGSKPDFQEILPSPFEHASQASLYLPKEGKIPDPATARREGFEEEYFAAVARELSEIIRLMEGRTLALFHSRREMEGVVKHIDVPSDLPILMQFRTGAGSVGERFIADPRTSLFALRSFWTGFDAPGETLSCVVLVRIPFEVPVDPPQIARMAWLQTLGHDPFKAHTLQQAKMMMRQGAGRLIRRSEDCGIIALLDPRLRTKRYGEEILENLPPGMRMFDDFADAAGHVGIEASLFAG